MSREAGTVKSLFAGSVSGVAFVISGHPFDTVKVKMQTSSPGRYRNVFNCAATIARTEGLRGFYRGLSPPLMCATPVTAIWFFGNAVGQKFAKGVETYKQRWLAGTIGGMFGGIVLVPAELVKCLLQNGNQKHLFSCIRFIYQTRGLIGMYRGCAITWARELVASGLFFANYGYFLQKFHLHFLGIRTLKNEKGEHLLTNPVLIWLAGAVSGPIGWTIFMPLDVIKSRHQTSSLSYPEVVSQLFKTKGILGFYAGLPASILRAIFCHSFLLLTFEKSLSFADRFID